MVGSHQNTNNIQKQNIVSNINNANIPKLVGTNQNTNNANNKNTNTQENKNDINTQGNLNLDLFNAPSISANQQLVEKLKTCNDIVKYIALLQSSYPLALVFQLEYGFANNDEKAAMLNKFSQHVVNKTLDQSEIESRWNLLE